MKNKLIIILLLVLVLFGSSGLVLDVPHPSSASPNVIGSASSEEENIDSMDVFPSNRWDISDTSNWDSHVIDDGLLNLTNTGDGTQDIYKLQRDLRDLDGSVETRFRISSNHSEGEFRDNLDIGFGVAFNTEVWLSISDIDTGTFQTLLRFFDTTNSLTAFFLSGDELVKVDEWYRFRIDYDILRSELRFRLFFDNNSKVFDYDIFEINANRARIFDDTSLSFLLSASSFTDNNTEEILIDYVKAPFKEREWGNQRTSADGDWIDSSVFGNKIEDDIADFEHWRLTVPRLDAVTGSMFILTNPILNPGDVNDLIYNDFLIHTVDDDDGDLHELLSIKIQIRSVGGGGAAGTILVDEAGAGPITIKTVIPAITTTQIDLNFQCSLMNDRTNLIWSIDGFFNDDFTDNPFLASGEVDVSDTSVDASQEFVIETFYSMTFVHPVEVYSGYKSFSIIERDIFSDLGHLINDVITGAQQAIGSAGTDILSTIFRWLANVLTDAWETIIGLLQAAIEGLLGLIIAALDVITTAIGDIADDIWAAVGDSLDFIVDVVEDIWQALITILDDIIAQLLILAEDLGDFIFAVIEFILAAVVDWVDAVNAAIFFIWTDVLGLPDVLAFVELLITTIFDVMTAAPDILIDIMSWIELFANFILIIWWFWAIFLSFAEHDFNPFEGTALMIEKLFMNLLPFSLLGFEIYVPQGLMMIPLTVFLILQDSLFNIW